MRRIWVKRAVAAIVAGLVMTALVWFAWPRPIPIDLATVTKGPMEVTVDDEAKTRVRHVYTVSAPLAGKVLRNPRQVGDAVTADETVVAIMQPTRPAFHDIRTHEELEAALAAAEAAVKLAEADVRRIEAALAFARTELERAQKLARTDSITLKALDKAKFDVETNEAALASAKAQLDVRRYERASAAARLAHPTGGADPASDPACCVQIRAPVSGRVLKLIQESEGVVPAGAPLIDIGDPLDLEINAELLSTDAVRIAPGSSVRIDGWGGAPIRGRVNRVEPTGFLKVSALGIEEQRVRTIIDFVDPPDAWSRLGHDYRVIVHVTVWQAEDVLRVPVGALFRKGDDWVVFAVQDGRARVTTVKIGQRNSRIADVLSGLSQSDRVVLHPSDRIRDGIAVAEREAR
jgi:HlyD family secretion protein